MSVVLGACISDSIPVKFTMSLFTLLLKCCCVPSPKSCLTGSSK